MQTKKELIEQVEFARLCVELGIKFKPDPQEPTELYIPKPFDWNAAAHPVTLGIRKVGKGGRHLKFTAHCRKCRKLESQGDRFSKYLCRACRRPKPLARPKITTKYGQNLK